MLFMMPFMCHLGEPERAHVNGTAMREFYWGEAEASPTEVMSIDICRTSHASFRCLNSISSTTTPGTLNVETQSNESQASEVIPETLNNSMADGSPDDQDQALSEQNVDGLERLPAIIPMQSPVFRWGEVEGEEFGRVIEGCYEEVASTLEEKPIFKIPSGRAGKSFVRELTRMFQAYADASALESMALQARQWLCRLFSYRNPTLNRKRRNLTHHTSRSTT